MKKDRMNNMKKAFIKALYLYIFAIIELLMAAIFVFITGPVIIIVGQLMKALKLGNPAPMTEVWYNWIKGYVDEAACMVKEVDRLKAKYEK